MIGDDKLLPFRDYDEHEVINLFALDGLAPAGTLVKASVFNPMLEVANAFATTPVGYVYGGVTTYRWINQNKVVVAQSGDSRNQVLGLTLYDVKETNDHGQPLIFQPDREKDVKEIVISGETVPIVRRGLFRLHPSAYVGTPTVNYVAIAADNGKINFVSEDSYQVTGVNYNSLRKVIGKCISTTGTQFSGNCYMLLDLP